MEGISVWKVRKIRWSMSFLTGGFGQIEVGVNCFIKLAGQFSQNGQLGKLV